MIITIALAVHHLPCKVTQSALKCQKPFGRCIEKRNDLTKTKVFLTFITDFSTEFMAPCFSTFYCGTLSIKTTPKNEPDILKIHFS